MVRIAAMARASCPRRALVLLSVLRRSCPKYNSHELSEDVVRRPRSLVCHGGVALTQFISGRNAGPMCRRAERAGH